MRILVISDSHRNTRVIDKILSSQPNAQYVFFLGDNIADIEDFIFLYPDKKFFSVSGNCDFAAMDPSVSIEKIDDIKILYTHGHTFDVKYTTARLLEAAKNSGCKIALYGHTHISKIVYEDGVYLVNPGSCSRARQGNNSYCVIDIEKNGIMPIIIEI